MDINLVRDKILDFNTIDDDNETFFKSTDDINKVIIGNKTNVVSGEVLRKIQITTLDETRDYISKTYGPMGSNTKIITGANYKDISSSYSKDGLKVLSNIMNDGPIEASIVEELIEVTRHVEKEVGDGTTSTVVLSSYIFKELSKMEKELDITPYELIRTFISVVDDIKKEILTKKEDITNDDIYNICMISTNGNEQVANDILHIYRKYGFDVDINVGISNNSDTLVKSYDGLTITEGMSDPVYINNRENNTAEIHNPKIYHFADPVDDLNMISLFEAIIQHNIYDHAQNGDFIPTVITCPKLTSDMSSILKKLATQLYQYDDANAANQKPPILIITDVVASDEVIMDDIANLCGCKTIHKYINKDVMQKEIDEGIAPTVENVCDFGGEAELVVADNKKTKFINPVHMTQENGEPDPVYTAMINFIETELEQTADKNPNEVGLLKKRLSALKANMVDYLVGGITVADRDNVKDLAEDAIKNCRSAAANGVGYASNFEGFRASMKLLTENAKDYNESRYRILECIGYAYYKAIKLLYSTVCHRDSVIDRAIIMTLEADKPYNIAKGSLENDPNGSNVLGSIMTDIHILDTISKIITRMVTCNQCLLQASSLNTYE